MRSPPRSAKCSSWWPLSCWIFFYSNLTLSLPSWTGLSDTRLLYCGTHCQLNFAVLKTVVRRGQISYPNLQFCQNSRHISFTSPTLHNTTVSFIFEPRCQPPPLCRRYTTLHFFRSPVLRSSQINYTFGLTWWRLISWHWTQTKLIFSSVDNSSISSSCTTTLSLPHNASIGLWPNIHYLDGKEPLDLLGNLFQGTDYTCHKELLLSHQGFSTNQTCPRLWNCKNSYDASLIQTKLYFATLSLSAWAFQHCSTAACSKCNSKSCHKHSSHLSSSEVISTGHQSNKNASFSKS